ncbi:MAG: hypothetical protein R3338_07530, partial [Thermoanaerobaculia bacterium]|nr:hypothetical protein [Thermoanaerobaculia bacterium]
GDLTVRAARTPAPPLIDGIPNEEIWELAPPISGFVQQQPDTGEPSEETTVVRLLYDDDALYVAAWLYDRGPVTSLLARRDSYIAADWFAIYLDPHHDHRTGLMFRVSPVGVERDAYIVDEFEDRDWDAV